MPGEQPGLLLLLRRGALRRCPVCGRGKIFSTLVRTRRDCSECGWLLEREQGSVTGAMYLIAIFAQFFAVALWLLLLWLTDWSAWTMFLFAAPLIVIFSLLMLPVSKGIWIAVEYYTDLASGDAQTDEYRAKAFRD